MRDKAFTLHPAWIALCDAGASYQANVNSPST
mgnify:CR=1 FL=1